MPKRLRAHVKDFSRKIKNLVPDTFKSKSHSQGPKPERMVFGVGKPREQLGLLRTDQDKDERVKTEDLQFYAFNDPLVFIATSFLWPQAILYADWYIEGNEKAEKECRRILDLPTLKPALLEASSSTLRLGDGYMENIYQKDKLQGFSFINSATMKVNYDKFGQIKKYEQHLKKAERGGMGLSGISDDDKPDVTWKPDEVTKLTFWRYEDSIKGVGLIEPLIFTLDLKRELEQSIADIVHRFANPFVVFKKEGATKKELRKMRKKLKNLNRRSFFCGSEQHDVAFKGIEGSLPDLPELLKKVTAHVAAGVRIPRELLVYSGEEINRATLQEFVEFNRDEIAMVRSKMARMIEQQVFEPALRKLNITGPTPKIRFNPPKESTAQKSDRFRETCYSLARVVNEEIVSPREGHEILKTKFPDYFPELKKQIRKEREKQHESD